MSVETIVAKFGGSSLGTADNVNKVVNIIQSDPRRRLLVFSAPGKRNKNDDKVTDMLFNCHKLVAQGLSFEKVFDQIAERYTSIATAFAFEGMSDLLGEMHNGISQRETADWVASRGEWAMARMMAYILNGSFIDAANVIKINGNGQINPLTYELIAKNTNTNELHVFPGFYASNSHGKIKTFDRGGSDFTGSVVAKGSKAKMYQNWTDVDGLFAADPRIINRPNLIDEITYAEMRELNYRGAEVLQVDTVLPVFESNIPINIRNTFDPDAPGTIISRERSLREDEEVIALAGKSGFSVIEIKKFGMNKLSGIGGKLLNVFGSYQVPFEQMPMGLDSLTVVVQNKVLEGKDEKLIIDVKKAIEPDSISTEGNLGLICIVGQGLKNHSTNVASRLFSSLDNAEIGVKTISYGASGNNIVVGIDGNKVNKAIKILYSTFIG